MAEPAIELSSSSRQDGTATEPTMSSAGLVIDKDARAVSIHGRSVTLTPQEFSLLVYFVEHTGRLLTRPQLVHEVWGRHYGGGPRTVDIHVSRLRRKLGASLPLDTLRSIGYRFGSRAGPASNRALESVE